MQLCRAKSKTSVKAADAFLNTHFSTHLNFSFKSIPSTSTSFRFKSIGRRLWPMQSRWKISDCLPLIFLLVYKNKQPRPHLKHWPFDQRWDSDALIFKPWADNFRIFTFSFNFLATHFHFHLLKCLILEFLGY